MLVIPAIDIIDGRVVRLEQGDFGRARQYRAEPAAVVREFERDGARRIHIIDLDGARLGSPRNRDLIIELARAVTVPVQVGGGIRSCEDAAGLLDHGVQRVIIGTAAVGEARLLRQLIEKYGPDRVAVSVDCRKGQVAVRGWTAPSTVSPAELAGRLYQAGVRVFVVTDIEQDGMLSGPGEVERSLLDFRSSGASDRPADLELIIAGGVSRYRDIVALKRLGVSGAIIGRALYEGRVNLPDALATAAGRNELARRIIPCLDVKNGRVVKGTHFRELRDAGDPVELGRRYSELGADELVFLDITATLEARKAWHELISRIAEQVTIPFTVGGGVSRVEDVGAMLAAGADKVSIGSAALLDPELVRSAAERFGSQCIVISVDARRHGDGWRAWIRGGTEPTEVDAVEFSARMARLGAGELLVNSLDRDGTRQGFDLELLNAVCAAVDLPVIASSGAGRIEDFIEALTRTPVDAVLAASVFHYGEIGIAELKEALCASGIPARV